MATKMKTISPRKAVIKSPAARKDAKKLIYDTFMKLQAKDQMEVLTSLGVGGVSDKSEYYTCYMCGKLKKKSDFYSSSIEIVQTCLSPICVECGKDIASPLENEARIPASKESIKNALYYLNKPFVESIYNTVRNRVIKKETNLTLWGAYINALSVTYKGGCDLEYRDSGNLVEKSNTDDNAVIVAETPEEKKDILEEFAKNKKDVLRLIGYLPFERENLADQPLLYAQLVGFLGTPDVTNDDGMRNQSIVAIVRGFNQITQIDNEITKLTMDSNSIRTNISTIRGLQAARKGAVDSISKLAEDNCISLRYSKNAKKGEDTWTGKIKKIKDINLRSGEVNGFDIDTCKAMRQVCDMSNASIISQLRLDESEQAYIIAEQLKQVVKANEDKDKYKEINRILLRENIDLKDTLFEHGLLDKVDFTEFEKMYSVFDVKEDNEEVLEYAAELYDEEIVDEKVAEVTKVAENEETVSEEMGGDS